MNNGILFNDKFLPWDFKSFKFLASDKKKSYLNCVLDTNFICTHYYDGQ